MDGVVVTLHLLQQLHETAEDAVLVGFNWPRVPDAEGESLRIRGRVFAELRFLASQIKEFASQLAGGANVLCDDQEDIFLLVIRANISDLSCEFACASCLAQRYGNVGQG